MRESPRRRDLRLAAALVATLPVALVVGLALARHAPLDDEGRFALGFFAPLPIYLALSCAVALVRSPARAWLTCAALGVIAAALALA